MTRSEKRAIWEKLKRWRENPVDMVREEFGAEPDAWQADALRLFALPETLRLAMKACKGPGKTTVLSWILLNFLGTRDESKVIATSITGDNLADGLWPECSKWMQRSAFFRATFEWTKTRIVNKRRPENWFASARTWPKKADATQQANALAGPHADHILFILDESGGMPQALMITAEAVLATGVECKVVQSGNPTHLEGPLHRACTIDRALWAVVTITGDPRSPKRSPRINLAWAEQQIKSYGRDNPWVMVNVLGEFPPSSINALLGIEEVEAAMRRVLRPEFYDFAQKRIGVDVARFGDDRTVLFPRQGLASFRPHIMRHARTDQIAAKVQACLIRWGGELALVDNTGPWGFGVIDQLQLAGASVIGVNYSGKALDPRYKNRRAEMWLKGAESIRGGAGLPNIPDLIAELTVPTYTFVGGVFLLEDKDQIKERIGRSPDLADAYMQTYAIEDMPGGMAARLRPQPHARTEFDPYAPPDEAGEGRALTDFDPYNPLEVR